jgi:nucleoside-diphosphate-sugar epimerase
MTRILCEQKAMEHIWVRICSVYGPYDGENTMVMSLIGKLLRGERPALTGGEQLWDYLYAADAGRALALLQDKGISGRIYCLGSGQARPLLSYIEDIRDSIDPNAGLGVGEVPYAPNQVMHLCADITALTEDTGFTPEYTFARGIQETIAWYRQTQRSKTQP